MSGRIIIDIVRQHAEESANLRQTRSRLLAAAGIKLRDLARFDGRLAAHLDGLAIAGEAGLALSQQLLADGASGGLFVLTVRAIEDRNSDLLRRSLALSRLSPDCQRALLSAFGWVSTHYLRGLTRTFITSSDPAYRLTGVSICALHRVDPGIITARLIDDPDGATRARAWRSAGELGIRELVSRASAASSDDRTDCGFWAAWSAVLLGDKLTALEKLAELSKRPGEFRAAALQLSHQAMSLSMAHDVLQEVAANTADIRWLIRGAGVAGDPAYVPWLIGLMNNNSLARLAGEAFSSLTGIDLSREHLRQKAPAEFESGPNDDPNDPNVDMDEDDGLPWPDPAKIQTWWHANSQRFQPGMRYFMGQPLNRDHCLRILKEGFQRQRIAAALYLSLLNPGTPLFEWRAPARRQQRLLAEMS
jgi:uncharacterized protein (TIGR02270 family)